MKDSNAHNVTNEQKWDKRSLTYDSKRFDYMKYFQKKAIAQIDIKKNMSFLDLGCGTGWAVCYVAKRLDYTGHFFGIDISGGMIDKANENVRGHDNISFIKANSENLPFINDFFDNIICTNSFHHYLNPDKVIAEIHRVLKVNGKICILDITSDDFFIRWINQKVKEKEEVHVNFYSSLDYKDLFCKHGLRYLRSKWIKYPLKVHIAEK
jgi:ubiquinone/menaquinone biosynthesis C-methylase UbiE